MFTVNFVPEALNAGVRPRIKLPPKLFCEAAMERSYLDGFERALAVAVHGSELFENPLYQGLYSARVFVPGEVLETISEHM
jgi:hypothetical protein